MAQRRKKAPYGLGSTYPNKDGSWTAAVRFKPGQKPVRRSALSREAAEALRLELLKLRDADVDVVRGSQPFDEYSAYWYNEVYLQRGKAERSNKHTLDMLELHILPTIGNRPLLAIDHTELQKLLN